MIGRVIKGCVNRIHTTMIELQNLYRIKKSIPQIKRLRNIHEGERCFIIGNGPSLKVEDLEKLTDEISFGVHRIYKIFDKTTWRPTYYCAQDRKLINESASDIGRLTGFKKIIGLLSTQNVKSINDVIYTKLFHKPFYPELPEFSDNMTVGIWEAGTVTYMCMQIAVYMGFKEMILLGVDHSYSVTLMPDRSIKKVEGVKDYFDKNYKGNIPQLYKTTLAYEKAKQYADAHGVKIYNATRGGKLEVFERVDFDNLFIDTEQEEN